MLRPESPKGAAWSFLVLPASGQSGSYPGRIDFGIKITEHARDDIFSFVGKHHLQFFLIRIIKNRTIDEISVYY